VVCIESREHRSEYCFRFTFGTVILEKARRHWDDSLRLCGSITLGVVRASDALRALQSGAYRSSFGEALDELGRIAKTLFLLAYLDDPVYRRVSTARARAHSLVGAASVRG
jgi:TnpA family transposase